MNLPRLALIAAAACVPCLAITSLAGQDQTAQALSGGGDNCVIDIRPLDDEQIQAIVAYKLVKGAGDKEVLTLYVTPTQDRMGNYHKIRIADEKKDPLHDGNVPNDGAEVVIEVTPGADDTIDDTIDATLKKVEKPKKPSFTRRDRYKKGRPIASPRERFVSLGESLLELDVRGLGFSLKILH